MLKNTPKKIITHHAVSPTSHTAQDVDAWHKVRWPGFTSEIYETPQGKPYHVGYHYVIEWNGNIIKTRGEQEEGAHCIGMNTQSIGVCFIGNFDNHMPSASQEKSFRQLYSGIYERWGIPPSEILPHRRYANKSCHGNLLSDDYFGRLVVHSDAELKKKILDIQALILKLRAQLSKKRMSTRERK